jgi:hypothetical protein
VVFSTTETESEGRTRRFDRRSRRTPPSQLAILPTPIGSIASDSCDFP